MNLPTSRYCDLWQTFLTGFYSSLFHDGDRYHAETSPLMQSKSMDWFLYDNGLCHETVNAKTEN